MIAIKTAKGLTIGTDAELMLTNKDTGQYVSGVGIIPGYKNDPVKTAHGWIQSDNVNAEFNIPPARTATEFSNSIVSVFDDLYEIVDTKGLNLSVESAAYFPWSELQTMQAMLAGCDPDFNFWTLEMNIPPDLSATNLRTASAHIHLGYPSGAADFNKFKKYGYCEHSAQVIRAMDLFLAVPAVIIDDGLLRKQLYGKAGCGRYKPYGVEHRTLSNFWLKKPDLHEWVFNNATTAYERHRKLTKKIEIDSEVIIGCINNNDKEVAQSLINKYDINMP